MSNTLYNYEQTEEPNIVEKQWVYHPTRPDKILGALGINNGDSKCFVEQRTRHPDADVQDYYRKIGGYSLVTVTAKALRDNGINSIFIEETDNDRFVEYETSSFISQGESLEDWKGDDQICCPVSVAVHEWDAENVTIARMK
jgi:hypothetical protein